MHVVRTTRIKLFKEQSYLKKKLQIGIVILKQVIELFTVINGSSGKKLGFGLIDELCSPNG